MSSRFIALPVGQGDSFYLQRKDIHILVDGGRSRRAISGLLKNHTNVDHLDIVVCTHNDADHANGIIDLLEEQPVKIREVWLPGTWAWRFEDLVTSPENFFLELLNDIYKTSNEVRTLEDYYRRHVESNRTESSEHHHSNERSDDATGWFLDVINRQENVDFGFWLHDRMFAEIFLWNPRLLLLECLNAAKRINEIVEAALNAGTRIRLFEFEKSPDNVVGGNWGQLEPVNSREVSPRRVRVSASFYIALSTTNRKSLVFYAPECLSENMPAVLFCADSDIACGLTHLNAPSSNIIATAPHHGSDANAAAYQAVLGWKNPLDVIWVRSDCRTESRPGTSFKIQANRLCTLCNPPSHPKSAVRLHAVRSRWQRTRGTQWCTCK